MNRQQEEGGAEKERDNEIEMLQEGSSTYDIVFRSPKCAEPRANPFILKAASSLQRIQGDEVSERKRSIG